METLKTDATRKKNGHEMEDCLNYFQCANYSEKHIAGSKDCEVEQKDEKLRKS